MIGLTRRLAPAEALAAAAAMAPRTPAEVVPLERCAGRRLAEPVISAVDLPEAAASAMDGWAVRAADTPGALRVTGESAAGRSSPTPLAPGEACRISTGALLPAGADAVVRLEDATDDDGVVEAPAVAPGRDVRPGGSEVAWGALVLGTGRLLSGHDAGAIAAVGLTGVRCHRPARVALIASGDELVEPGGHRPCGAVIDSNRPMLRALIAAAGGTLVADLRVPDRAARMDDALHDALMAGAEVVMTVGGASTGTQDHVRAALARAGAQAVADGLAMRPGHPTWLGRLGGVPVLALPGNPGASMVAFHLLGRALLGTEDPWTPAPLAAEVGRAPRDDRFMRCRRTAEGLLPLGDQRPGSVSAMAGVDALAWVAAGPGTVPAGDLLPASLVG